MFFNRINFVLILFSKTLTLTLTLMRGELTLFFGKSGAGSGATATSTPSRPPRPRPRHPPAAPTTPLPPLNHHHAHFHPPRATTTSHTLLFSTGITHTHTPSTHAAPVYSLLCARAAPILLSAPDGVAMRVWPRWWPGWARRGKSGRLGDHKHVAVARRLHQRHVIVEERQPPHTQQITMAHDVCIVGGCLSVSARCSAGMGHGRRPGRPEGAKMAARPTTNK
jgi:hypothetical protein